MPITFSDFSNLFIGGVQLTVLVWLVYVFYNGDVISKKSLDSIIASYQKSVEASMEKSIERVLSEIKKRDW